MHAWPAIGRRLADKVTARAIAASPWAARLAGRRMLRQGRLGEAEVLMAAAAARFPGHRGVLECHALVAQQDGRFVVAVDRWRRICALRPADVAAWIQLAFCARVLGDTATAFDAGGRALVLQPKNWRAQEEVARAQDAADRPDAAGVIWAGLVARRPGDPTLRQGYADHLIRTGQLEAAEQQIVAGLRRHPEHRALVTASGTLAMRREDWDEAFAIWSRYVAAHPDDALAGFYLMRVASVRRLASAAAQAAPLLVPVEIERVEDEAIRALMLRFESIGADCEFGTVQRRYGAEPLGLLRWNDVSVPMLIAALAACFAGMGEPEMTEITVGEIGELCVRDRRWNLAMHTFLFDHEVSRQTLFPKMCRRVRYLRDKLLDDLAAGEKVFVFKSLVLSREALNELHAALRAFGPACVLHVRPAATAGLPPWPDGAPGSVTEIAPALYVGYVANMSDLDAIPFDEWVAMCRAVAACVDAARRLTPAPLVADG